MREVEDVIGAELSPLLGGLRRSKPANRFEIEEG